MHFLKFTARDVAHGQSAPAFTCQGFAGLCLEDAVIIVPIAIFIAGLVLLTLGLNVRASRRSRRRQELSRRMSTRVSASPPPYSSVSFPQPASRESMYKSDIPLSPSLDPYHVVSPSFDASLLLRDEYFHRIPQPDRAFAPSRKEPGPSTRPFESASASPGLASPSTLAHADTTLAPPPPVYVQDSCRGLTAEDATPAL